MARTGGKEAREWIMFLVAIGLVIYFAVSGVELSPWWLMLLGAMLGLSVLVTGIQRSFSGAKEEDPPPTRSAASLQQMLDKAAFNKDPKDRR